MKKIISTACILLLLISGGISACDQDDVFNNGSSAGNIQNKDDLKLQEYRENDIISCCFFGDNVKKLQDYISEEINVNFTIDYYKNTPLHIALDASSIECANLLIDHLLQTNEPVTIKNKQNQTPLHLAFGLEDKTCADKLFPHYIKIGVPLNEPDAFGKTFLHNAITYGHTKAALALIDSIVKNEGPDNLKDKYKEGCTHLHNAVHYACEKRTHDYDEIIRRILFYDANSLTIANSFPKRPHPNNLKTPLDTALFYGAIDLVDLLVDAAPGDVLKNWRSAMVKDANLMLVLETLGLSDAEIEDDEQQKIKIRETFFYSCDKYKNDSKSHDNIMGKLSHKCRTDRHAEV